MNPLDKYLRGKHPCSDNIVRFRFNCVLAKLELDDRIDLGPDGVWGIAAYIDEKGFVTKDHPQTGGQVVRCFLLDGKIIIQ